MTRADDLRARQAQLELELHEVHSELLYLDCPGEGRCHGCAVWCDRCGDVLTVCDAAFCDRHICNEPGCRRRVEHGDDIVEGYGRCRQHADELRVEIAVAKARFDAEQAVWARHARERWERIHGART